MDVFVSIISYKIAGVPLAAAILFAVALALIFVRRARAVSFIPFALALSALIASGTPIGVCAVVVLSFGILSGAIMFILEKINEKKEKRRGERT